MSTTNKPRTLQVQFDDWKWRKATIYDIDDKTELYQVECHLRKPHIVLLPIADDIETIKRRGEISMHTLSSRISLNLHGQSFDLTSCGIVKNGYTYTSSTGGGAKRTWKSKSRCGYFDLILVDEATALTIARMSMSMWHVHKAVKIEFMDGKVMREDAAIDEVILTGLAVMQQRLVMYNASLGASSLATAAVV